MVTFLDIVIAGLLLGGLYALIAMGLSLQYGVARVLNVSHGEFIMLGGMLTWTLYTSFGINPLVCIVICGPIALVIGYGLHHTFFRHLMTSLHVMGEITILGTLALWTIYNILNDSGFINVNFNQGIVVAVCVVISFILDFTLNKTVFSKAKSALVSQSVFEGKSLLLSFGLLFIIQNLALTFWGSELRSYSYLVQPVDIAGAIFGARRLVTLGFAVAIGVAFYLFLARTRMGKAIRAAAQDPTTAGLMGVNINLVLAICFGLGAALAGTAGVLISMCYPVHGMMGLEYTIIAIIVVVLGGMGSIPGSFIGGFILGIIGSIVTYFEPGLALAAYYIIFIILLLVRPKGIMGR